MFAIDNYDFSGKRAIIRVDFNVPLNGEGPQFLMKNMFTMWGGSYRGKRK